MVYVALLRGINVGGNNPVEMKALQAVFEAAGMTAVRTYINSGNVVFSAPRGDRVRLARKLESAIERRFGFAVGVLVREAGEIQAIAAALPEGWANDDSMKCDVFYLWDEIDEPSTLSKLGVDPAVEDVLYTPGAIVRRVDRKNAARSRMLKLVGTPLYQQMTVRNCNTARQLARLAEDAGPVSAARERPRRPAARRKGSGAPAKRRRGR